MVGGKLADRRGRRLIGAVGVGAGVVFTVGMYLVGGWSIWMLSLLGSVFGAMAVPALGVYGPELFPTAARGAANGVINLASVVGSAVGLVLAGVLSDRLGGLGPAMAVLSIGGVAVVLLVLFLYPETASLELEDLNPHDAPLARELFAFEGLDPEFQVDRFPLGRRRGPGLSPVVHLGSRARATPRTRAPTGSLSPVPTSVNPRLRPPVLVAALLAVALLLAAGCGSKDRPTLTDDTLPAPSDRRRDLHHDARARASTGLEPARASWPRPPPRVSSPSTPTRGDATPQQHPGQPPADQQRPERQGAAHVPRRRPARGPELRLGPGVPPGAPQRQHRLGEEHATCSYAVNDYRIEVTLERLPPQGVQGRPADRGHQGRRGPRQHPDPRRPLLHDRADQDRRTRAAPTAPTPSACRASPTR